MSDWLGHSAGDESVGVFINLVANRDYSAAEQMLTVLVAEDLSANEADRLRTMLSQAQRLAADQERLAKVVAGLANDEHRIQAALLADAAEPERALVDNASGRGEIKEPGGGSYAEGRSGCVGQGHGNERYGNDGPNRLAIWLLGSCRISLGGRSMDLGGSDRATAVLRFLAAQPAMGVHKEQLAERFWPETGERSARRSLHQVIYNIRRRLLTIGADGELQFQNDRYLLGGGKRWRDVDAVERLMAEARSARNRGDTDAFIAAYDQVDTIYVGDFLADHLFAEWAETQRRHYRQLHREAVGVLLEHYQFQGQSCRVVHLAERLLNLDPADEDAVQRLMRAHVDLGNQHLAADVFAEQTRILADGLGVPPCPESLRLARELLPGRYMDEWSMSRQ